MSTSLSFSIETKLYNINWNEAEIKQRLTNLSKIEKDTHWIRADLSIKKSYYLSSLVALTTSTTALKLKGSLDANSDSILLFRLILRGTVSPDTFLDA